ncbi:MAG TPA: DinB family protein [Thermoanaerobaculia bacterium]|jgi:hypothetical protein|nr:DinB family protein [Thermoanaerobaculia bacterium]
MSTYSNLAGEPAAATAGYVRALLDLLGDRDALAVLAEMVPALETAVAGLDHVRQRRPEQPGKWSVVEVAAHLADSELVWGFRLRRVLAEERPRLEGYDQDRWAQRLRYRETMLPDSLALFRCLRESSLRLLRAATPADLQRVAIHAERGEETLAHMIKLYAAHDLVHLRQIARIRAAVEGPPAR